MSIALVSWPARRLGQIAGLTLAATLLAACAAGPTLADEVVGLMGLVGGQPAHASAEGLELGSGPLPWPDLAGPRRSLEGRSVSQDRVDPGLRAASRYVAQRHPFPPGEAMNCTLPMRRENVDEDDLMQPHEPDKKPAVQAWLQADPAARAAAARAIDRGRARSGADEPITPPQAGPRRLARPPLVAPAALRHPDVRHRSVPSWRRSAMPAARTSSS